MEKFVVRPALDGSGKPLIEFLGNHRSENFPSVLTLLERELPEFTARGENPVLDDFIWKCTFAEGSFELSDDWGGLFVLPEENPENVVVVVAAALERSGHFCRVTKYDT